MSWTAQPPIKYRVQHSVREFLVLWASLTFVVTLFIPGIFRSPFGDAVFLAVVGMFVIALPAALVLWLLYRVVRFAVSG